MDILVYREAGKDTIPIYCSYLPASINVILRGSSENVDVLGGADLTANLPLAMM